MRITIRRVSVIFDTIFTDENGEVASPDSATLTIVYPDECYPLDGSDLVTATIDMTSLGDEDGTWTATWYSGVSNPGLIEWHAEALTGTTISAPQNGFFRLRGNSANLSFVNA